MYFRKMSENILLKDVRAQMRKCSRCSYQIHFWSIIITIFFNQNLKWTTLFQLATNWTVDYWTNSTFYIYFSQWRFWVAYEGYSNQKRINLWKKLVLFDLHFRRNVCLCCLSNVHVKLPLSLLLAEHCKLAVFKQLNKDGDNNNKEQ